MATTSKCIAIIGAGKLGVTLAQLALKAGYSVYISGSGSPEKIRLSMDILAHGAVVDTVENVASKSDIVILAMPLGKYESLSPNLLAGKLVIDAMNYWWEIDGNREDLKDPETSTSEIVQAHLSKSRVVKALSHMGYHHLHDEAKIDSERDRKAIAIAGDSTDDVRIVSQLVCALGFDPLPIGPLSEGKKLEPGHHAFGANVAKELLQNLVNSTV